MTMSRNIARTSLLLHTFRLFSSLGLQTNSHLLTLEKTIVGKVVKRPSAFIKSPYVADVHLENQANDMVLAHCPSLGCQGLADIGATVVMTPNRNNGSNLKTNYKICLSLLKCSQSQNEVLIGINPKLAEDIVEIALNNNYLTSLKNITDLKREVTVKLAGDSLKSRFDFSGLDEEGRPFFLEVKNVPLADFEDISAVDRRKKLALNQNLYANLPFDSKVAYFPDGYRKVKAEPVSPRAIKHLQALQYIKGSSSSSPEMSSFCPATRCIMCYVIQRDDVCSFSPSVVDPSYRRAFEEALLAGVEVIVVVVKWCLEDGSARAYFVRDNLPLAV